MLGIILSLGEFSAIRFLELVFSKSKAYLKSSTSDFDGCMSKFDEDCPVKLENLISEWCLLKGGNFLTACAWVCVLGSFSYVKAFYLRSLE